MAGEPIESRGVESLARLRGTASRGRERHDARPIDVPGFNFVVKFAWNSLSSLKIICLHHVDVTSTGSAISRPGPNLRSTSLNVGPRDMRPECGLDITGRSTNRTILGVDIAGGATSTQAM